MNLTKKTESDAANFSFGVDGHGNGRMGECGDGRAPKRARPGNERDDAEMIPAFLDVDKVSKFQ